MDSVIDQPKPAMGLISKDRPETDWRACSNINACRTQFSANPIAFSSTWSSLAERENKITGTHKHTHEEKKALLKLESCDTRILKQGNINKWNHIRDTAAAFTQFHLSELLFLNSGLC